MCLYVETCARPRPVSAAAAATAAAAAAAAAAVDDNRKRFRGTQECARASRHTTTLTAFLITKSPTSKNKLKIPEETRKWKSGSSS